MSISPSIGRLRNSVLDRKWQGNHDLYRMYHCANTLKGKAMDHRPDGPRGTSMFTRRFGNAIKLFLFTAPLVGALTGSWIVARLPANIPPAIILTAGGEREGAILGAIVGFFFGILASAVDHTARDIRKSRPTSGLGHLLLVVIGATVGVFLQRFVPGSYGGSPPTPRPSEWTLALPGAVYGVVT